MKAQYSIAICPPEGIIREVAGMKKKLFKEIGWFPSCNSEAHITFNVFEAGASEIVAITDFLQRFSQDSWASEVRFDKTGTYPNGALYLAPDDDSKIYIVGLMNRFHFAFPGKFAGKRSVDPHISIARQLKGEKFEVAKALFAPDKIDVVFSCNCLCIRKFNTIKKQYDVEGCFGFEGVVSDLPDDQFSLFD